MNVNLCGVFYVNIEPLASPGNLRAISRIAPDKIHLGWNIVPDIDMAGIRRGYTITYTKTKDVGDHVLADEKKISVFDPEQTEIVVGGLEYYCEYSFVIRVFNTWFYSDNSEPVYGGE